MHILSPEQLHKELPLPPEDGNFINSCKKSIGRILSGEDRRLLLIAGPCSIHDIPSALEYASKLQALSASISPYFFPIMRVYFEKPRTKTGWKGFLSDPHLNGTHDIALGMHLTRKLLITLASMGIATATEFLEPLSANYFADLISWGCIGARTVESQVHRQLASQLTMPVAFKNNTSGNIDVAINAIIAAKKPHTFIGVDNKGLLCIIESKGNPYGHLVLRGGSGKPNCDLETLGSALCKLQNAHLPQRLLIDCSHDNCERIYSNQIKVFKDMIKLIAKQKVPIRGLLLESHINEGNQLPQDSAALQYGVSITDPCLNWQDTQELLLESCCYLQEANLDFNSPIPSCRVIS